MARVVRDQDGNYVAIKDDGTRVPIKPSLLDQAVPARVLNEQGVSTWERFTVKNLTSSQDGAMAFLRAHGYEVRQYGDHPLKWQFAVRKSQSEPWKVVDPDGFDAQDLTDMVGDVVGGTLTGLGTVAGGGLGSIATGAASGAAVEAGREALGSAAGVPDNFSPGNIVASGAVGGAVPVAAKLAGQAGASLVPRLARGFSRLGDNVAFTAAKIAGVRSAPRLGIQEALQTFARAAKGEIVPLSDQAVALHAMFQSKGSGLFKATWPEAQAVNDLLVKAKDAGAGVNLRPIADDIEQFTLRPGPEVAETSTRKVVSETTGKSSSSVRRVGERTNFKLQEPEAHAFDVGVEQQVGGMEGPGTPFSKSSTAETTRTVTQPSEIPRTLDAAMKLGAAPGLPKQAAAVMDWLYNVARLGQFDLSNVPIDTAHLIKGEFQQIAREAGVYGGEPVTDAFSALIRDAGSDTRMGVIKSFRDALPDQADSFIKAMDDLAEKQSARNAVLKAFRSPKDLESFLRSVHGTHNASAMRAVQDLEEQFGVPLLPNIKLGHAAELVSPKGATPGTLAPIRSNIFTGMMVGAGLLTGHAPATAAGLIATSPKTIVPLMKYGPGMASGIGSAGQAAGRAAVSKEAQMAAIAALQESVRSSGKGIASQTQTGAKRPPKRVTDLTR